MRYVGSKRRIAKDIITTIHNDLNSHVYGLYNYHWVEPFVGAANMIGIVGSIFNKEIKRIGNDIDPFIIYMLQYIQQGWIPPENISEEQYMECRNIAKYYNNLSPEEMALIGFIGYGCSFGGKWFGGYARWTDNNGNPVNYCKQSRNSLLRQRESILEVEFRIGSYLDLQIPEDSIIYCDPPYENSTKYKNSFNHDEFWKWCDRISENHFVYVSEYVAPKNWKCIWEKEIISSLDLDTGSKHNIERLFIKEK